MEKSEIVKKNRFKTRKSTIIGLSVATAILEATTLGLGISQGITSTRIEETENQLEGFYKKNYYDLIDSTNTCDTQMSKLLSASTQSYRAKMLEKVSQSAKDMQNYVSSLPLSFDGILECTKFINQMSGYTQTLQEKIDKGETLSEEDLATLEEMHQSINELKDFLNDMSQQIILGKNIIDMRNTVFGEYDGFSWSFSQMRSTEYPTMIYDGPFSDSVENKKVEGLSGEEVSQEKAYEKINSVFNNVLQIDYIGQTNGKFETYNFKIKTAQEQTLFVQVTKIGGNILTISGRSVSDENNISKEDAEKIALNFAKENGVQDAQIVWSQELNSQIYFNITPVVNDVICYPDLVKVKVDLENGNVIGYDAISYYTNHKERNIEKPEISLSDARELIGDSFEIETERLAICPLEYNREVLCYEFKCYRDNSTFYIYINAVNRAEENILKVVETSNGDKLM